MTFRVAEEVPISGNFESGDDVGFYEPDAEPVAPEKIERYLRIAGWAHGDLLLLIDGLDDKTLDWVRDSRTRSIRKVLRHIVGAELWYMSRVVDERGPGPLAALIRDADAQSMPPRTAPNACGSSGRHFPALPGASRRGT